ncbi:MAG TPA: pitrilysin family protein [Bryobacteraceae bacterium]|nr:pitrilysin family protein [Bryobacteraceae bacterium]
MKRTRVLWGRLSACGGLSARLVWFLERALCPKATALVLSAMVAAAALAQDAPVKNPAAATIPATKKPASTAPDQTQVRGPAPFPSWESLKFTKLKDIKIPKPAEFTLPNGMRLYLLEDHELPIVSGFALVRTGNLFDPKDKIGLAEITGHVMRSGGTEKMTGDQMDVALENVAASVESGIGESSGSVSFSCLKENTPQVLGMFHDVLTQPAFRQDKIDLLKTQLRSEIARRNDEASQVANREFADIVYGRNTPYGWMMQYSDVDNIHRDDLVAFYKRYYFPANVMLAVYGDFSTDQMKDQLTNAFSGWNAEQPPVPKFPEVVRTPAPGVYVGTKTDVTQTFFQVGHLGGEFSDKDYPALAVAGNILGGGFSSRLMQEVREKLGYVYDISAYWGAQFDHPGLFQISGSTQSKHTLDTLEAIERELKRIRTTEVTPEELKTAKDTVLNSFVFLFDRPSKTLNRVMRYKYYGYPDDFIFQFQKAVEHVTREDVLRVAKEYFKPQDLTIVAVGNPADFGAPLTQLGMKVQPIDLTIPEPARAPAAAVTAQTQQQGRELLVQMQKAMGGPDKLAAVRDTSIQATASVEMGGQKMQVQQLSEFVAPSGFRQETTLPFGKMVMFSDGQTGWGATPQGTQNLPPPMLKEIRGELFRDLFTLALSDRDPNRTVSLAGPDTLRIADKDGDSVDLKLDPATHLPASMTYQSTGRTGPVNAEEDFSDWRQVSGLKAPFHIVVKHDGAPYADVTVQKFTVNSGLTADALSQKPTAK